MSQLQAILALEDGQVFSGVGFGASGCCVGEVVFNTAMTGYQEILTDPSYAGQIVTLTASHVGNTGINSQDHESNAMHCMGLVVRDYPRRVSSWRAEGSLDAFLQAQGRCAIAGVDTRALTAHLRHHGAMNGAIVVGKTVSADDAIEQARQCPPMQGLDLASGVSVTKPYEWTDGVIDLDPDSALEELDSKHHVVCVDFGVKRNMLRILRSLGCRVTVVPAKTSFQELTALEPNGVLLSNGPGDPRPLGYAIDLIRDLLASDLPILGICLGHQLLALGAGASTIKMKFGHHGANHPVKDESSGQVFITSQNHGFAVDETSLPEDVVVTHRSLFDGSIQGIRIRHKRAMSFQGHPEASPGPHDLYPLFNQFVKWMAET